MNGIETTAGGGGPVSEFKVDFPKPDPTTEPHKVYHGKGFFDVYVRGLDELLLVPISSIGKAILARWLGREALQGCTSIGADIEKGLTEFSIRFEANPSLSPGGVSDRDGRYTLTREELEILKSTLLAHRNGKVTKASRRRKPAR